LPGCERPGRSKEERSSFLKKRSKKLLFYGGLDLSTGTEPVDRNEEPKEKKFFASFFQKRSAFFLSERPQ
jgi:hypothetical protein